MNENLRAIVNDWWNSRSTILAYKLDTAIGKLDGILSHESRFQSGESEQAGDQNGSGFGEFAHNLIDESRLESILTETGRKWAMSARRYQRIQAARKGLAVLRETFAEWARAEFLDYTNPDHVSSRYDSHQNSYADACAMLRVADLESGARYQPEVHDAFFRNFTWRNLNDEEADLAPPCVVHMRPGSQRGARMGELIELFSGGRPLKVFVLQEHAVFGTAATGRAAINQLHPDFGFMGIALRRVFVVQGVPGEADLTADILTGLQSHRPAIFSLLETDPGANPHLGSAHLAIASRAFPRFVYNPDAGIALADCLDISENPDPDSQWASIDGRTITYADFAARDLRLHSEFTPFQTEVAHGVTMNNPMDVQAYLELPAIERRKHTPVVIMTNADGNSTRLVPSRSIIEQTMDRAQLWLNLQSMAGKGTLHAPTAPVDPSAATDAESPTSANNELQQQREAIEQQAVTRAITNLVARLALGN